MFHISLLRARICKPFKEPRNRFPAWRVEWNGLLGSIPLHLKRLQIRAQLITAAESAEASLAI